MNGPDWTGMAIVGVPLGLITLALWMSLRRDARRASGNPALAEALRRHPAKGRGSHERLGKAERLEFEPQFRRIAAALEAEMADTEGWR